jgi:hypothetical protein
VPPDLACSAAARAAADDPAGSATDFDSFLLLTSPGAWGRTAAEDAVHRYLDEPAATRVLAAGPLRPFAIRPPSRSGAGPDGLPAYLGRVGGPMHRLDSPPGVEEISTVVDGGSPASGIAVDRPLIAVCTNGSRDRCCAVAGRPIVTALAAVHGAAVTEISHIGGHRYAGTLLVLPTGYSYGFLDPATARAVAADAFDGLVHPAGLRGRAGLPPAAQAAESFWRRAIGPAPPTAVQDVHAVQDGGAWTVTAIVQGAPASTRVRHETGPVVSETVCGGKPFTTGRWLVDG